MSHRTSILLSAFLLLTPGFVFAACNRSKDPPPMPATSAAQDPAQPSIDLEPEDAGDATPEAGAQPIGTGRGAGASLAKCCAALRQNAESSPQKEQMLMAAGACDAAVKSGSAGGVKAAVAPFAGGLPAGCL
jgi:hypothetical protein